jgi:tRNA(Ile)-lysidine synthase
VAVAVSGGRDSTALLHATVRQAATLGHGVVALHVHHGLHPQADAWARHVRLQCQRWARSGWPVQFDMRRLSGSPAPGNSVEAWARRGRYAALADMAHAAGASLVLLAHHRRDQAETVLLQALRGAGAAGLSAMPRLTDRQGLVWARLWRDVSVEAIDAYVRRWRLSHIEDSSNTDLRFDRNRLRLAVWPALRQAFPQVEASLAAVAQSAADTQALIAEVALSDLASVSEGPDLRLDLWLALSLSRRRFVLHAWLARMQPGWGAAHRLLDRLLAQLPACTEGQWPAGRGGVVRLDRGRLSHELPKASFEIPPDSMPLSISLPGEWPVPAWSGELHVQAATAHGLAPHWLNQAELRARHGGEQFQSHAGRPPRSLKKQFQAAGVPRWSRDGPLLWAGDHLLFVPGLGVDARVQSAPGLEQWALTWQADQPAAGPA